MFIFDQKYVRDSFLLAWNNTNFVNFANFKNNWLFY